MSYISDAPQGFTPENPTNDHSPVGLYNMDGNVNDTSGNTRNLTANESAVYSNGMVPGTEGVLLTGTQWLTHNNAVWQILGDITVMFSWRPTSVASSYTILGCIGGGGDTEAENALWSVRQVGGALQWDSEHGAGIDDSFAPGVPRLAANEWIHFVARRESDVITFFLNGKQVAQSSALTTPTGGGSGYLWIGSYFGLVETASGTLSAVKIVPSALTDIQIQTEATKVLGL